MTQPQGLQPGTVPDTYPHLGFNPAPGSTDTVHALRAKLIRCADVLEETHGMITKLMDGSYWKGDAATAFRDQLEDGPLPLNLKNAAHSIRKAAKQLDRWETDLGEFQDRANRLNDKARTAREILGDAESNANAAKRDTGSSAGGGGKSDEDEDEAKATMRRLNAAVAQAQADLERILSSAKNLAWEHENKASDRAARIRDATDKLAPQEPGFFEKAAAWISENLPDILSVAAGVVALAALTIVTGGTATAVLLLAASALSAGALGLRLSDSEVWSSLLNGFTKGQFDADFFSNLVSVGADFVGIVPGLAAVGQGIKLGAGALRTGSATLSLGQKFGTVGSHIMTEARAISALDNPTVAWIVHGARMPSSAPKAIEVTAASIGVISGGITLLGTKVDALDNDGVGNSGTVFGGLEIAGVGSGDLINVIPRVFP
ncbi:coiled-coil domain-containing protein [Streptomyces aculeolatus]